MIKFCVGIDISKLTFHAAIRINGKEKVRPFSNNENGFKTFLAWLQKYSMGNYHCCMESTGKYGLRLAEFLHGKGHIVSVVNPAKIKYFMKSQLARNKTDLADSKSILHYCELFGPAAWAPAPIEAQALQALTKRLDALIEMKLQEENRLENVDNIIKESIVEHVEFLEKEIKKTEKKIKIYIDECPNLKENAGLLMSVPGLGKKTISKILAFFFGIEKFSKAKKAAAYVGLNPQHAQSGSSLNQSRLSKTGDADLRKAFYMPTLVAIRHNPIIKNFYEKLVAKGKPKKKAICAAMRKLVHIVYGVLKNKRPFDANWPSKICNSQI